MSFVVSLTGFRPAPRYDGTPWVTARIEEAASAAGPFAALETVDLVPDPDPTQPSVRDFTTDDAQLEVGWYRVVFLDEGLNETISESVFGGTGTRMPPTVSDVRARSRLIKLRYPAEPYDGDREEALRVAVDDAVGLVQSLTCRTLDASLTPDEMRLAMRAVTLKAEQLLLGGDAKSRKGAIGTLRLRSFSAGPYSETYFGPGEAQAAKALDLDPATHEVLWALATEECRRKWLRLWGIGKEDPAAAIQTFPWANARGSYGRS